MGALSIWTGPIDRRAWAQKKPRNSAGLDENVARGEGLRSRPTRQRRAYGIGSTH